MPTSSGYLDFTFSQDRGTTLRVFVSSPDGRHKERIWENHARSETNGVVSTRAQLPQIRGAFRLIFQAEVEANYQYTSRTYLSQVVVDRVVLTGR